MMRSSATEHRERDSTASRNAMPKHVLNVKFSAQTTRNLCVKMIEYRF